MMGKTHLAGGVALAITAEAASQNMGFTLFDSVLVLDITSSPTVMIAVGLAGVASLLPDLDHAKSTASNLNFITRMMSAIVRSATTHRGGTGMPARLTHWLATCLMLTGGIYLVWPSLAVWFFIGYASHLALDMMTISGVKVGAGRHARARAILLTNMLFTTQVYEVSHRCVARDDFSFFPPRGREAQCAGLLPCCCLHGR